MQTLEFKHLAEAAQAEGPDSAAGRAFREAVTPENVLALIADGEAQQQAAIRRHKNFLKLAGSLAKLAQESGYDVGEDIEGRLQWVRQLLTDSQEEHAELVTLRRHSRIWKSPQQPAPVDIPVLVLRDAGAVGNSRHPGYGCGMWIEISKRHSGAEEFGHNVFLCDLMSTGHTIGWAPLSRFQDLEAMLAGVVPPEGWHLLPSEPLPEQLAILGGDTDGPPIHVSLAKRTYRELLRKAPKPSLVNVESRPSGVSGNAQASLAAEVIALLELIEDDLDKLNIGDSDMPASTNQWNKVAKLASDMQGAASQPVADVGDND